MNSPVSFLTNLRHDHLQRNKMFSWDEIINVLKHSRGNINPFTTFKPCGCGLWKNLLVLIYSKLQEKNCDYILIIYMKKYEKAYHNYVEAKHAKIIYSKPANDIVRLVKTTVYNQNNNIHWYFPIFKVRLNISRNCWVWFVTSLYWINPLLHLITYKPHLPKPIRTE